MKERYRIRANVNKKTYYVKHVKVHADRFTVITWTPHEDEAFLYPRGIAENTVKVLSENGHYYDFDIA